MSGGVVCDPPGLCESLHSAKGSGHVVHGAWIRLQGPLDEQHPPWNHPRCQRRECLKRFWKVLEHIA
jgi:hypothetical protein